MKTLQFEGYSDDTFGEYGVTNQDIDNCGMNRPIQCIISSSEGSLMVIGHYHLNHVDGCWTIGISKIEEGSKIPDWAIRFKTGDCKYSPLLEIDVPDDFSLTWYNNGEEVIIE